MMSRRVISEEDRALAFVKGATLEQLIRLMDVASIVREIQYPQSATAPVKRTRGPAKKKEDAGLLLQHMGPQV